MTRENLGVLLMMAAVSTASGAFISPPSTAREIASARFMTVEVEKEVRSTPSTSVNGGSSPKKMSFDDENQFELSVPRAPKSRTTTNKSKEQKVYREAAWVGGATGSGKPKFQEKDTSLEYDPEFKKDVLASSIGGVFLGLTAGELLYTNLDYLEDIAVALSSPENEDLVREVSQQVASLSVPEPSLFLPIAGALFVGGSSYATAQSRNLFGRIVRILLGKTTRVVGFVASKATQAATKDVVAGVKALPDRIAAAAKRKAEETAQEIARIPAKTAESVKNAASKAAAEIQATPGRVAKSTRTAVGRVVDGTKTKVTQKVEQVKAYPGKKFEEIEATLSEILGDTTPQA